MTLDLVRPARALLSVSDKSGLADLGRALAARGVELLSTGGTAKALADAGLKVIEVADYTGFPEMLDGRVKTLHPKVHGGLLGRRDLADHRAQMDAHKIPPIDVVVSNLYPFEATVAAGKPFDDCIENIDIGGPSMVRSAAKNHDFVVILTDPSQYAGLLAELESHDGATTLAFRRRLAGEAYARTAAYDAAISSWMAGERQETFPERIVVAGRRVEVLRYGENPHQEAAFYATSERRPGVATARQVQGKELSYNNLNDTDAAYELVAEFEKPAIVVVKHANPCGVAVADTLAEAYRRAFAADPVSAFGGIIAANRPLDAETVEAIGKLFAEVIIAPDADPAARGALERKTQLRLLLAGGVPDPREPGLLVKSLAGGLLVQGRDIGRTLATDAKVVTKRAPTAKEMADLLFAFTVCKHVKSNAIVLARDGRTVGVGAGQMSRVDSARLAGMKAAEMAAAAGEPTSRAIGSVVGSDAFFPFADGLIACAESGATAVIQPGGSKRDDEIIAAADERNLAMVFTGKRHFRH
ncbi:MAG: bifunctional phosphoribosylaminoimidazolecarboxamide formyltransferase/IMP cyclohydrolase [Alphaproteobacteria bacterium]|nr:bifunctional phosphoribosylaminoimidazolecarboxamide formyltransferase/IMP cyclohydrolase [Alphaproteobacteria bacterium]